MWSRPRVLQPSVKPRLPGRARKGDRLRACQPWEGAAVHSCYLGPGSHGWCQSWLYAPSRSTSDPAEDREFQTERGGEGKGQVLHVKTTPGTPRSARRTLKHLASGSLRNGLGACSHPQPQPSPPGFTAKGKAAPCRAGGGGRKRGSCPDLGHKEGSQVADAKQHKKPLLCASFPLPTCSVDTSSLSGAVPCPVGCPATPRSRPARLQQHANPNSQRCLQTRRLSPAELPAEKPLASRSSAQRQARDCFGQVNPNSVTY